MQASRERSGFIETNLQLVPEFLSDQGEKVIKEQLSDHTIFGYSIDCKSEVVISFKP